MRALAISMLLLAPAPAIAQTGGRTLPPIARVRSEVNLFLELHNHLQFLAKGPEDTQPEYRSEVKAYRDAKELAKDRAVWQLVYDACIAGPDMATIARVTDHLPSSLAVPDQEAVRKVIGALESAWPRFKSAEGVERQRSLQSVWSRVMIKHWGMIEERVLTTLYDKFVFEPIDAKITVYPVIDPVELGAWGKTPRGYYVILPVARVPSLVIIEEMLHEVTHVLADRQPPTSNSLLKRLARQASGTDRETLDQFMEGLVAWNAGELIRRLVSADYKPLTDLAPNLSDTIEKFLPTYQGPWAAYIEGKISADDAIKGMLGALKPVAAPAPSRSRPVRSSLRVIRGASSPSRG